MKTLKSLLVLGILLVVVLSACSNDATKSPSKPIDNPSTSINESIVPGEGQPDFPKLGSYWVADPDGSCGFTKDTALWASSVFDELRLKRDVWIAVLCQKGIKNISGLNNERMWMVDWVRWFNLGSAKNDWAVFVVFRPDVPPEENRVLIERTYNLTWFSPIVYMPILQEVAKYANADDFNGALESLIYNIDPLVNATMDRKNINQ